MPVYPGAASDFLTLSLDGDLRKAFARWYPGMHVQKEEERRAPQAPVCNGL